MCNKLSLQDILQQQTLFGVYIHDLESSVVPNQKKKKKKYDWEGMTPSYYGGVWQACSLNQDCCIWLTLIVGFCSIRWQVLNGFLYFVMQLNVWIFEMCSNTLKKAFFFSFSATLAIWFSDFNCGVSAGSRLPLDVLLFHYTFQNCGIQFD